MVTRPRTSEVKNKITQVWYEVELDSQHYWEAEIAHELWLSFDSFNKIKGHNLMIKMSREYYHSTIEFNFIKEPFSVNLHNKTKKFINAVMKKYDLTVYGNSPSFVWTHIHFFRSWLNNESTDTILKIVLWFIIENINDLHKQSVERIVCSHQLWWNYAHWNKMISDILGAELGKSFAYPEQSRNRPKYRPVIHSPRSTTWKLRSTEVRMIPTEFILNDKVLEMIERLKVWGPIPNEDIPSLYLKLVKHYKWMWEKQKKS